MGNPELEQFKQAVLDAMRVVIFEPEDTPENVVLCLRQELQHRDEWERQATQRVMQLQAQNTRLTAPLSPEECEEHGERDKDVEGSPYIFTAGDFEAILVSRCTTPIPRSTQCETQP